MPPDGIAHQNRVIGVNRIGKICNFRSGIFVPLNLGYITAFVIIGRIGSFRFDFQQVAANTIRNIRSHFFRIAGPREVNY